MTFQGAVKDTRGILGPFYEASWTDFELLWLADLRIPPFVNEGEI